MDNSKTFSTIITSLAEALPPKIANTFRESILYGCSDKNPKDAFGYNNWLEFKNGIVAINANEAIVNPIKLNGVHISDKPKKVYIGDVQVSFMEEGIISCNMYQIYKIALMEQLTFMDIFKLGFHYGRWRYLSAMNAMV